MIKTKITLDHRQQQALVMTTAMQQSLRVLQLPILELAQWLQTEIEQNPALQFDEPSEEPPLELDFEATRMEVLDHLDETFVQALYPDEPISIDNQPSTSPSLFDHLMSQARTVFTSRDALHQAEQIIGSLDQRGFLGDTPADPATLAVIQTFDPPGVGARNLQESLLIQLRLLQQDKTVSYRVIEHHFDHLIKGRFLDIGKKVGMSPSELHTLLKRELFSLRWNPAASFQSTHTALITPDIVIEQETDRWIVQINDSPLPKFQIVPIDAFHKQALWVATILKRRTELLTKIAHYLLEKHAGFFHGTTTTLMPTTMMEISHQLNLHESTIGRAVKEKYLQCPRGIFPLRYFFPHGATKKSDLSHIHAKELLATLIEQEDKRHPLSDASLAAAMGKNGIPCARRTISKYRHLLKIPSASLRRQEE